MSETVYIYGLYDPRDGKLRYVGKTINLQARLWDHVTKAKSGEENGKSEWIGELLALNLQPEVRVLEETDEDGWAEAEKRWIADCLTQGYDLLNVSKGGGNPPDWAGRKQSEEHIRKRVEARRRNHTYTHSEKTKRKISRAKRGTQAGENNPFYGKSHSKESRRRISRANRGHRAWNKGISCSEETKQKISEAKKGQALSVEARKKLSRSLKGRKLSPEHARKLRQANLGKCHSEETRQKLREANLGKHHSEETKEKLRQIFTGRYVSEETRRRIGEAKRGQKLTPDQRRRRSQKQKAKWQDPEYRARMLEAQRKRRERERLEKLAAEQD